jgi:hypothetical protein
VSNTRSLPAHTRREHFPLDASLLNELSFSNFPLLYSSRSGVLCPPTPDAKQRGFAPGRHGSQVEAQTQQGHLRRDGLLEFYF